MITRAVTSRVAILDDYQRVALASGPWESLGDAVSVTVFDDHVADDDAVVERLVPFEIVVAMRERTPLPRARLERLPNLRQPPDSPAELTWELILALCRHIAAEDAAMRSGGWQHTVGTDLAGARSASSGSGGSARRWRGSAARSGWT